MCAPLQLRMVGTPVALLAHVVSGSRVSGWMCDLRARVSERVLAIIMPYS